jgi:hypothetical protein
MTNLETERATVLTMINLYCRQQHKSIKLCQDCASLWTYAEERLEKCPYGIEKPTCQNCPIHCYRADMRQKIKEVMRYAGPKMIFHHPVMAVRHLIHNHRS